MKKFLAFIALIAFSVSAQAALSETYLKKKLSAARVDSVAGIVEMYLADTGHAVDTNAAKVIVLLNGKPSPG